jgi:deazaflavin-dependent oxidoreductase (nitroreductase family)
MPLPRSLAKANKVGLNRLTRHIAPYLPGFGVVEHRGRKSGRSYRTPVNVFRTGDGFAVALTYGRDAEWVRNVSAAGGAVIRSRGKTVPVSHPRIVQDESRSYAPAFVRLILARVHVDEFLLVDTAR